MPYRVLRAVCFSVLGIAAAGGAQRTALAGTTEGSFELSVAYGYDSNPLELNREVVVAPFESPRGSFTRLDLDARLAHKWNPRIGYFVSASAKGRLHPSYLEDADSSLGRMEAGIGFILFARGERKLSAALRGSYGQDRSTFVDPATGGMYVTFIDPNTLAPIPDRFNVNVVTANADLRLRVSRRLLLSLDSSYVRQDYVEDYETLLALEPLDDRSFAVRPGLRWQVSQRVRIDVTGEWRERRYDGLSALEEDASVAAGTQRRDRTTALRTALRVEPSRAWTFQLGVGGTDREDLHAGYYDSVGVNAFASAAWAVTGTTRLGLHLTQASFDYERATLDFVQNGDKRGGDFFRAAASVERDLGGHVTLFCEGGAERSNNEDPLFAYDRNWVDAGLRLRL